MKKNFDFTNRDIISIKDFTREEVDYIMTAAAAMEHIARGGSDMLHSKTLATLFFEPSTRTRLSFEAAMCKFCDLELDGIIDILDLAIFGMHWMGSNCSEDNDWCGGADFNFDHFVNMIDFQIRRINTMGDMNWMKGTVIKKYVDNGEHLVDLDIRAENQDGKLIIKGQATVQLIARSD